MNSTIQVPTKKGWEIYRSIRMNWVGALTGVLLLWSSSACGANLVWDANSEQNLAGYRVYRCDALPCSKKSGAFLLDKVGKNETSFNIGTPAKIQYYFVTAYNLVDRESGESNVVNFVPEGTPPPPPTPQGLRTDSVK
jgi:hypothetical protein